ncbi:SAM-dependent methyltransferase [Aquabacterium lacunae]|uniref:SAM-dependent methyltransferase n=1 Tax=Aquabacterium lacunae TaxID=2528630 RepID=A0A4Q9GVL6_9BURK|nr:SAM-dependent methyltransferase [Aquabacterium lacunae]TBO27916.1 SAM-dependent methyltransferase [Aquabacterium lacunae]
MSHDGADAQAAANAAATSRFVQRLQQALTVGQLERLQLIHPTGPQESLAADVQRVLVRPVAIKGQPQLSFVFRHPTKDITANHPVAQGLALIERWLQAEAFRNAHLHTPSEEVQLAFSKKGKASVRVGKVAGATAATSAASAMGDGAVSDPNASASPAPAHNREKHRLIGLDRPFLRELGVTDARGQLVPAMSRKYKQINKFIEVLAAAIDRSPLAQAQALNVVDFGSGKGYLTFAVHDWLRHNRGVAAQVTGVELRDELVQLCQGVIDRLGLQGMGYEQGDVRQYHPQALNVMIALHACDVATDYAIHLGIRAGAEVILCSPCCHKEVRPQLLSPHPLRPLLKHGIHQAQEAEMLTDGLRALLLEAAGYDTQVFEFISLEHTNKNKMILAIKRAAPEASAQVLAQIHDLKAFYGIQAQCLETLLRADGRLG